MFLSFDAPGAAFHQSLLIGNGAMGAALHGNPWDECIHLSHVAFLSGQAEEDIAPADAPAHFRAARQAALRGDFQAVDVQLDAFRGRKGNYGTALPVGQLHITQTPETCSGYTRDVNLETGVATVRFSHTGGMQTRTAFCSHPDQALLLHAEDDRPMSVRVSLSLTGDVHAEGNRLTFLTRALETIHSDGTCGSALCGRLCVDAPDGCVRADGDALIIENCREWLLEVRMETDYSLDGTPKPLCAPQAVPCRLADYDETLKRHVADFSALMNRARLHLRGEGTAEYANRMFALGRYLTTCAAREDSVLPMNLQGVWNDGIACRIGWTCDEHLDVNTQMNYWLCEQTGLSECHLPLFRWMEKRLVPNGRLAAERHYGLPGWSAELTSNPWGYAQPYWDWSLSPCPGCGAWQALDFMTYVRKTGDRAFLHQTALPVLRDAARFFLAYLFEDEKGQLQSGPSISPENAFLPPGDRRRFASLSPTFEIRMIRALLSDYVEACDTLDLAEDPLRREALDVLPRLPRIPVLADGSIGEWGHPFPPNDPQHRHTSHLCGLYPLHEIHPERTPQLAEAARRSIAGRTIPYEQWEDTGWARSLLLLYAARLWDGETAEWHLAEARDRLTEASGLVMHPVTRATGTDCPVWELDGNTGIAAGIAEMLMQSEGPAIHVLPALPAAWREGSFEGLIADGAIRVSAEWDAQSTRVTLLSPARACVQVRTRGGQAVDCTLSPGQAHIIVFKEDAL